MGDKVEGVRRLSWMVFIGWGLFGCGCSQIFSLSILLLKLYVDKEPKRSTMVHDFVGFVYFPLA